MAAPTNYVRMEFPSVAENVAFARAAVAAFATNHFESFTIDEIRDLQMATSEAVTNAIVHGYGHDRGKVRVTVAAEGGAVIVTVEDEGRGIEDVGWARQPENTTAPGEHMGLGFVFIDHFMSDVSIQSRPGKGTVVRMSMAPSAGTGGSEKRRGSDG